MDERAADGWALAPDWRRDAFTAMLGTAALALSAASVCAGLGLLDGFGDWEMHRLARKFRRELWWSIPAAAAGAVLLRRLLLERFAAPGPGGIAVLYGIVRAFAHFPLHGFIILFGMMAAFGRALWDRLREGGTLEEKLEGRMRWTIPGLWFLMFPFQRWAEQGHLESSGDLEVPARLGPSALRRWMPWMLVALALWTGMSDEDTGERVDPRWLAAFGTYWLAEFLVVFYQLAPRLQDVPAGDPPAVR